jgi:hypothetical protein
MAQEPHTIPFLDALAEQIPQEGFWITGGSFLMALILDLLVRFTKTQKPMTVFHLIAKGCLGLARVFERLGAFLVKIGPQNSVEPVKPTDAIEEKK